MGTLGLGGAETMAVTAAENLADRCATDFLVFEEGPGALDARVEKLGGHIVRMEAPRKLGRREFLRQLTELISAGEYDAVHSHINLASGQVLEAAHRAGVPVRVSHSHIGTDLNRSATHLMYKRFAHHLIKKHSTAFAACSEDAGRHLFGDTWKEQGGVVVPNGVDLEKFSSATDHREKMRQEWGLRPDDLAVGIIARLFDKKNHSFMLDVMALDSGGDRRTVLFIVGDGPLRQELDSKAKTLELGDRVRFLGARQDIPQILGGLDLLAMPSKFEGLPVSLVEAQAAGLPALVADTVARESDMGLGLVTWLPLGDPEVWHEELTVKRERTTPETVRRLFPLSGFDSKSSAEVMLSLYQDGN